jgi:hypothetical protein
MYQPPIPHMDWMGEIMSDDQENEFAGTPWAKAVALLKAAQKEFGEAANNLPSQSYSQNLAECLSKDDSSITQIMDMIKNAAWEDEHYLGDESQVKFQVACMANDHKIKSIDYLKLKANFNGQSQCAF